MPTSLPHQKGARARVRLLRSQLAAASSDITSEPTSPIRRRGGGAATGQGPGVVIPFAIGLLGLLFLVLLVVGYLSTRRKAREKAAG